MKCFFDYLKLLLIMVLGGALIGCEPTPPVDEPGDDPTPPTPEVTATLSAKLVSATKTDAVIELTTKNVTAYAYVILKKDATAEETAEAIFDAAEEITECEDGTHTVSFAALESSTAYKAFFVGLYDENKYTKVAKVEFTTSDDFSMSVTWVEGSTSSTSAKLRLTTKGIAQYAWVALNKDASTANQSADLLFAKGKVCDCVDGENIVDVTGLTPDKTYNVLIAGSTVNDDFYEEVLKIEVSTSRFTEELTIFDIDYMSFKAHLNFPRSKVQEGNVIKVGLADLATYNLYKAAYTDADRLNMHDATYHNYIKADSTFIFDEEHNYFEVDDEYAGEEGDNLLNYFNPIVPAQPMYLMFGEFAYSPVDTDHRAGWGPGYYIPLFNTEDYWMAFLTNPNVDASKYWTGYNRKEFVMSKKPDVMPDVPEVTFNLTPKGTGTIHIEPTDNIWGYCFFVLDAPTYMKDMMAILNNNSEYVQWFTTSYLAVYQVGAMTQYAPVTLNVEDFYFLERDTKYYLCITSLGDEMGSKQSFKRFEFELPQPTKPAPTIVVTAVPEKNTSGEVFFNIKAPNKDVEAVKYVANYERDWEAMRTSLKKSGYPADEIDPQIINQYGGSFSAEDIKKINSDAGLEFSIDSREDASLYCGAIGFNDEGTASAPMIAQTRSLQEPAAERVESPLFNSLKGDWIATATIIGQEYVNNVLTPFERVHTSPVTIGEVGYEQTLPEEVYNLFFKSTSLKTKEDVDAAYAEFKQTVDTFNRKTRNQNRILCQGFDFDIYGYNGQTYSTFKAPYDLFISSEYSGYNYESPVYDFGPKWYLEISKDGKVTAPFNEQYFVPASQWWYYIYYFIGIGKNPADNLTYTLPYVLNEYGEIANGHFPVEVTTAADGTVTKIVVKPLVYEDTAYYPNMGRQSMQGYSVSGQIVSEIVLTPAPKSASKSMQSFRRAVAEETFTVSRYNTSTEKVVRKSKTALPENKVFKTRKVIDFHPVTSEEFKANSKKYLEKRFGKIQER